MLFDMLAGKRPFAGEDITDTLAVGSVERRDITGAELSDSTRRRLFHQILMSL